MVTTDERGRDVKGACWPSVDKAAFTQQQLDLSVEGGNATKFQLATSYAEVFLLLFVTLIYGGGMPLLWPLALLGLGVKFWADKWAVCRVYRDPPMTGDQFRSLTELLLPFAIMLHAAVAIWVHGRRMPAAFGAAADAAVLVKLLAREWAVQYGR